MSNIDRVRAVIADALYTDLDSVTPTSNLMGDLGAESIDFLDIMFRLEKEFSIKLPKGTVEAKARGDLTNEQFAVDGVLTPEAIANLKTFVPDSADKLKPGFQLRNIPSLFTVNTFADMVEEQLNQVKPE